MNSDLNELSLLYQRLSEETKAFVEKTGHSCKPGCGFCCMRPPSELEISQIEADFLLSELQKIKSNEEILVDLAGSKGEPVCPFLKRTDDSFSGYCQVYPARPLLCRLFGFGGIRGKNGKHQVLFSKVMREKLKSAVESVEWAMEGGVNPPLASQYQHDLDNLRPLSPKLPIDHAVMDAIERDYFRRLETYSS